ncbi:MAG TPA: DUF5597 domain-containing protein [Opitutaceae bacterium]|nr:DUF5597 domain-containing protein [Opitutaceae bacterium]
MKTLFHVSLFLLASAVVGATGAIPHLQRQGTATQLIVDGQPFIIHGGELGNSSGEPAYLHSFWPKLKALHLNAVVAPVYWDQIEPAEGTFNFATVDGLLADARANNMRLVLLWFGSWKNSMSCYTPAWVKADTARFPRARSSSGRGLEILSPFDAVNEQTDARAFATLMEHLKAVDGDQHTVVMVQVENEIGMIPEARDHSPEAEKAFAASVPSELMSYLAAHSDTLQPALRQRWFNAGHKSAGTWTEVFGPGPATEEIFMAWYFARYTDAVAKAGKAAYPLPMYVNAALIRPGHQPGQYPSAGPLPQVFDVWRAGAPTIDLFAPDIYFQDFIGWARRYTEGGNGLFIPEAMRSPEAAANALYAIGGLNSMGFSAFGIESIGEPAAGLLAKSYDLLTQLTPLIVQHQGRGTMFGLMSEGPEQRQPQQIEVNGYVVHVAFETSTGPSLADGVPAGAGAAPRFPSGGILIATGPNQFVLAGVGITAVFSARSAAQAGILSTEEGHYSDGQWIHERWLNGDETNQGRFIRIPPGHFGIQRVTLYTYR